MAISIEGVRYLYRVSLGRYHLLPSASVSQEINTKPLKAFSSLQVKFVPQKDGTRFKHIYTRKMDQSDIIHRLGYLYDDLGIVWKQTYLDEGDLGKEQLEWLIARDLNSPKPQFIYRAYITNEFLDSCRVVPIVIDPKLLTFYDASVLFPHLIPEDEWGVLLMGASRKSYKDSLESIAIRGYLPEVVDYLSEKRMCPTCGRVCLVDQHPKYPWTPQTKKKPRN